MKRAAAVVLLAALVGASGTWAAEEDPHGFLQDAGGCVRCHVDVPRRGTPRDRLRFQRDLVSLCLDCHREKDVSALHPVDIRPGARVPEDLPLDSHGAITCVTCHSPHGPYEAEVPYVAESLSRRILSLLTGRKRYRTFYLRRANDRGQLCLGCHDRALLAAEGFHIREASLLPEYAGSGACQACHPDVYREWRQTPHARMVRDARADPAAVLADFGADAPFPKGEVVYTLGSHWTQRYVVDKGGKLYVKAQIWSVTQGRWDTSSRIDKPWTQYCQGCHTTGFEMKEDPAFVELGIGCEACHGPGKAHAKSEGRAEIVNPARLAPERREMVCASCHTTGHDRTGQFRFPLGYLPGRDLTRYYRGLLPKPGQDNRTFVGDETYGDRSRQWQFWKDTFMDVRGLTCDVCQNFRSQAAPAQKPQMTPSEYCLTCHGTDRPDSELHRAHASQAVQCHDCHVPTVEEGAYSIHDHKFLFRRPETPRPLTLQTSCERCHRGADLSGG